MTNLKELNGIRNDELTLTTSKLSAWLGAQTEFILKEFLGDRIYMVNLEELARRGSRMQFPDGREVFTFDGEPIFEVMPLEFTKENEKYMVTQRINRLTTKRA